MFEILTTKGIRIANDAKELIETQQQPERIVDEVLKANIQFVQKEDVEKIISKQPVVEVKRSPSFKPSAKEFEKDIEIVQGRDVTGKSRTKGEVKDFVAHFRDRYTRISQILRERRGQYPIIDLNDVKKHINEKVRVAVIINERRETKKGNVLFEIEDLTGSFKAVVTSKDEKVFEKAKAVINDDIISLSGKMFEPFLIVEDIEWPDVPITKERNFAEIGTKS